MSKAFDIDKVRADLAKAALADASRRVVCPVDGYRTANIHGHHVLHGIECDCLDSGD